jgi:hypothetical protein
MSQLLCFDIDNMWRKVFHMGRMWLEYINKVPIILSVASTPYRDNVIPPPASSGVNCGLRAQCS